ncbi:MAG: MarR family transcriptional regulator [Acidiphilium sp. 21-60-14]|nr:MAG: MarR family transcriptional regulator [Acidiphilium sp. 21-60-14]OYV88901.1 MAG: MarR family transcriptional regulator [Acidiphilium sp. 37-60-79]
MVTPSLTEEDYRRLAAFRLAMRQFVAFSEEAARENGLTPRQHQALLGIKSAQNAGGANIADLAKFLIIQHHSAVELVDRLVRAGYVERHDDAHDRRRVIISLTRAGEEKLASLSAIHLAEIDRIGPELRKLLGKMLKAPLQN